MDSNRISLSVVIDFRTTELFYLIVPEKVNDLRWYVSTISERNYGDDTVFLVDSSKHPPLPAHDLSSYFKYLARDVRMILVIYLEI